MTFTFDTTITLPLIASVLTLLFAWWRTRRSVVDERLKTGSDRMNRHETRLNALEQSIKSMPTREDMHSIQIAMERMNGAMGRMEAVLEGNAKIMTRLETIVTRHDDHLLKVSD